MLKKLNIILVCSFSALTINYNIGFSLLIPVILFYLLKDLKNIYYTYIPSLFIVTLFSFNNLFNLLYCLSIITITYFLYKYISKKIKQEFKYMFIVYSCLLAIINLTSYLLFKQSTNIYLMFLFSIISSLVYLYLNYFTLKIVHNMNDNSILFLDILLSLIAIFGGLTLDIYNINFGLIASSYFVMYISRSYKDITSLVYSTFLVIVGYIFFKFEEFLFLPIISGMYLLNNIYIILPLNALLVLSTLLLGNIFESEKLISLMGTSILFEIASLFVVENAPKTNDSSQTIYEKIQSASSSELLKYALFLDKFANNFQNPKEYNEHMSNGIKTIVQSSCMKCSKQKECFEKYRSSLYYIFKTIIDNQTNIDDLDNPYYEFNNYCSYLRDIRRTCKDIEHNINAISPEEKTTNNILIAQMNGLSNTIKKYVLDVSSKKEIDYVELLNLKKALIDYGYAITYFEINKQYINDFLITIGVKGIKFTNIKEELELIATNYINYPISAVFYKEDNKNIYINIIPKIKVDVTYGFGSLSCEGLDICGDNYLVKEMQNGRFVSAISDGMGKGYRAFMESNTTLNLIEDIISLNISTETALDILNTYYTVQDYLEEYATLDFVEINRYEKVANFYKMGATSSYVFRKNGHIDKIVNKNLPFGIDDEITMHTYQLESGDLILMSSDGIFENVVEEEEFEEFISNIKNYPPQRIVYEILNYTMNHKIQTKDDMSIVALKVQNVA
mgnify:CR=1 FL=1